MFIDGSTGELECKVRTSSASLLSMIKRYDWYFLVNSTWKLFDLIQSNDTQFDNDSVSVLQVHNLTTSMHGKNIKCEVVLKNGQKIETEIYQLKVVKSKNFLFLIWRIFSYFFYF